MKGGENVCVCVGECRDGWGFLGSVWREGGREGGVTKVGRSLCVKLQVGYDFGMLQHTTVKFADANVLFRSFFLCCSIFFFFIRYFRFTYFLTFCVWIFPCLVELVLLFFWI